MLNKFKFPDDVTKALKSCPEVIVPKERMELVTLALGGGDADRFTVSYDVDGKNVDEVTVVRCKNGASVNYVDDYMRRRDPDCMVIADDLPTDKPKFEDMYNQKFDPLREQTMEWLSKQELIIVPFMAGGLEYGYQAALIAPKNAAFFACGLAGLQFFTNIDDHEGIFEPKVTIYLAPPFRHTFFDGKQMVVHNRDRENDLYEMFSYNLYPGPSAKKGIYGFLLDIGEREGWLTAHTSAVKVITPYENEIVMMHEGASGGGKSEMGECIHRDLHGKAMIGQNLVTNEKFYLDLPEPCELEVISDDMALCHPKMQNDSQKLVIKDAEDGWFLRVDNITEYGTEPVYEKISIHPSEPLVFVNLQGEPNSTCLIWEHIIDSNGKPCPNPRVIMPRRLLNNTFDDPIEVDVRSFGVRTPPCTKDSPNYGVVGLMHVLPPALGWLWRLVAPRGHNNPSIVDSEGIPSEGVGSYWPFATGLLVNHANLLLEQIVDTPNTRYVLIPNQHIGAYKVGFMPQWVAREYVARRGSVKFKQEHLVPSRLPLLGYSLESMKIDGQYILQGLLRPETQPEIGLEGYDAGSQVLIDFFKRELAKFNTANLIPLGKQIIDCCMNDGTLEDYLNIMPIRY